MPLIFQHSQFVKSPFQLATIWKSRTLVFFTQKKTFKKSYENWAICGFICIAWVFLLRRGQVVVQNCKYVLENVCICVWQQLLEWGSQLWVTWSLIQNLFWRDRWYQKWFPEWAGVSRGREFQDKVLQKFVSKIIKCG